MKKSSLERLFAFGSGALFAVGLAIAGMTQPAKVVAFLDVTGDWDPSLAFVMGGAIAVYATMSRLVLKRAHPLAGGGFNLPTRKDVEPNLVIGAAVFGIGWGLGGYCPGPGLTALGSGTVAPVVFVLTMALGMRLFDFVQRVRGDRARASAPASRPVAEGR